MSSHLEIDSIVQALRACLPPDAHRVALHEPEFRGNEWSYVQECLNTGWVSSVGKFVDEFERRLEAYTGATRAVVVVNGTAALHMALMLAGVEPDDEVLIPALTFVATANAVAYCRAVPHFIDSEERTLGVDPKRLRSHLEKITDFRSRECINTHTGRRITAVVATHTFGHPVDLDPLVEVCEQFGLVLIEDAAESLGSFYKERHTGNWGKMATLSFNGNKIVTTGGGGALLVNDEEIGRQAKHLTTTAKVAHRWEYFHDRVGYNYRLPNLNAAVGCAQMEQLPDFVQRKRVLAARYEEEFRSVEGVRFFKEPTFARSNYWLNVLLLDEEHADQRDELLGRTNDLQVLTRPAWTLMHKLPMFDNCPRMELSVSENLERRLVNIPSSAFLA